MPLFLRNRRLSPDAPVFIIAEAGVNHNGEIKQAHQLIDQAAACGADAVKFQTFITEEIISKDAPLAGHHLANVGKSTSHFDLIKRLELRFDAFDELKQHCEEKKMTFFSAPYDIESARFLIGLGVEIIKVPSSEMMNYPMLDVIRREDTLVMLSTGMSQWDEIVDAVSFVKEYQSKLIVLKCTSNYPASPESLNLNGVRRMQNRFPELMIGFSDHCLGCEASLVAVGMGVKVLERHFTLDKNDWGPDHKASMEPKEFSDFVQAVRQAEIILGKAEWEIQDEEKSQRDAMQKGVYARRELKKGEKISITDVRFLRPSSNLSPKEFFLNCLNRQIKADVVEGELIMKKHFIDG